MQTLFNSVALPLQSCVDGFLDGRDLLFSICYTFFFVDHWGGRIGKVWPNVDVLSVVQILWTAPVL